jgi:chromosome condensin MukBEF ATPase and DNA-binding subunit MukB
LPNNEPETLLDVIQKARERCANARALLRQIDGKMQFFDGNFGLSSFYDASLPNEKKFQQLENEIASIPNRTEDIENRWRGVLIESRRSFHTILKSLEEIQKQIQKLNRELAKMEFSSLSEVRLEISPERSAVSEYERYSKDANQPSLFDAVEDATRRLEQFNQLLQRRPRLVLNDLFSLRCEVRRKDGIKNHYDDLDQIESTGTTIVLKVILNLLVLRDLLIPGKARIPYYLDEVHALDRQNLANIIHLSERLGFVGIYAAPTDAAGPRRFVYLVPDAKGRLVVTPNHQKDIVRMPGESPLPSETSDATSDASASHE